MILSRKTLRRVALMTILIVPFLLREVSGVYEPYPAILLPSWGQTATTRDGTITFGKGELLVIFDDGSEQKLDPELFFNIIPTQYWPRIGNNHFGLERRTFTNGVRFMQWKVIISYEHEATPDQRRETISWIRQQLTRLGITHAHTLRYRWLDVTFDIRKGIELKKTVKRQFEVQLAQ